MIYQFSPFLNENLILRISSDESRIYGGTIYITESNRDFHYRPKKKNYENKIDNVVHQFVDVKKQFVQNNIIGKLLLSRFRISSNSYKRHILRAQTWYNEAVQRNISQAPHLNITDDDIIILCDIDEILDSKKAKMVFDAAKKYGIVTGKLYFTLFYFNLFSKNWGGAADYSYRMFVMTGRYYKNISWSFDELRKKGECGELMNEIHCIDDFIGFHHSWLGDEQFVENKINSYAHVTEHKGLSSKEYIQKCMTEHKSIFPDQELEIRNDINLLDSVERFRSDEKTRDFFI